jgi:hypothetical protein
MMPRRHNHAHVSQATIDQFIAAVDRGRHIELVNFAGDDADLLDALVTCARPAPDSLCRAILIPRGSTIVRAARELQRWLAAREARQACVQR